MSLKIFKRRFRALLLFFIDYKALLYCFTILSMMISGGNLLERVIFENKDFSFLMVWDFLLPPFILILLFSVSYRVFCGVYFFDTLVKIFLVSTLLVLFIVFLKYGNMSSEMQKVVSFTGKKVWITGVITSQEKSNTYLFHSPPGGLGNSLVRLGGFPVLHSGQRCNLFVKVVKPKSFEDFDYERYLFRKGIYSILEVEEYECSNVGNIFLESRYILERVVEKAISEPEASLLIGIMFGSKRVFRSDFNTALNTSGVSHVIGSIRIQCCIGCRGCREAYKGY